ncbi:MAG TPA: hypothetical protein VGE07_11330 [Herpetosiphonaceae bacterium]
MTLILGPLVLLTGMLLRLPTDFFFPAQIAALASQPARFALAYGCVAASGLLLWPAILLLTQQIAPTYPGLARWAGIFVLSGVVARTFHAGADHMVARLVEAVGVTAATQIVSDTYGVFSIMQLVSPMIMAGWVLLAAGSYRAGVLGPLRAGALALMAGMPLGILKGTTITGLVAVSGLCLALIPLGMTLLRIPPHPAPRQVLGWTAGIIALVMVFFFLGTAG